MTSAERIAVLAQNEIRRRARAFRSWFAGACFVLILALGAWNYSNALPPRPEDDRLFGYAYLLALLMAFHIGLARDRRCRFDACLTSNFVTTAESYFAKIVAAVVCVALNSLITFAVALVLSAGDFDYSAWYPILFLLVTLLFLPSLVLIEFLLDIEYPVAVVGLLFMAVISILNRAVGAKAALHVLALDIGRFDYGDLWRLAVRSVVAVLLTFALAPIYSWRIQPRSGRTLHA